MSEKAGSGCPGDEFLGLGKSGWKPLAVSRGKYLPGTAQLKANALILTNWKGQKTNSGQEEKTKLLPRRFKERLRVLRKAHGVTGGSACELRRPRPSSVRLTEVGA